MATLWIILCVVSANERRRYIVTSSFSDWARTQNDIELILVIDDWSISCEIALRWMSLDITFDKSK